MAEINVDLTALPQLTNPAFYPLYADRQRYLVLYGGAGSGKSVFAAQKLIVRTLAEPGHKFLIVRKVAKTLRHSTFALLRETIGSWGLGQLFRANKTDMELACPNGSAIIHAGLDDVEKLKSIHGVTGIWIEEASEITPEDFRQLDIRLRGRTKHYKQIILSFNPVSITHWLKEEFFDNPKPNATVLHTTYKDNRFLDEDSKQVLEAFRDTDEYYYTVYCLGQWGVLGRTVYNGKIVTERLIQAQHERPLMRGTFVYDYVGEQIVDESIRFVPDDNGPLKVWEPPQKGWPYVLGGDIAEGGLDWSTASVRNNVTLRQAATWRGQMDTDLYAKQMYCLGRWYNNALIGIETNFDLHPVKELERLGYRKQYVRETMDRYSGQVQEAFGFKTTKITRPVIIAKHVALAREHIDTFSDPVLLDEMLTFVRNEQGRPEAQDGKHDDMILADAICYEIRSQQTTQIVAPKPAKKELPFALQTEERKPSGWLEW